ncbi:unnamed protein product [Meganyctiphanes norvegica]|uniref:Uncharacterized protein n=1 Tax=Meganyctiphanes norvegica TaxID=48144 RepID=A0AAV2R691_MEGNR
MKNKYKRDAPNYAFVNLHTEEDVKKIMNLNNQDCFLSGLKLIFRPAFKHFVAPGEKNYVRMPLPDRDYDLSPLDPSKPSIHVLVDDVLMKILEYVPLKERILCEVVCRWWQALLYVMFESTIHLNLDEGFFGNSLCISKAMVSKMLLLTGETLKSLSLSDSDNTLKKKLFSIIPQLCPNLENLDLSDAINLCFNNVKALKDCKKLKYFSAKSCIDLKEKSFEDLISVLPCLEKIDVNFTAIKGDCFNLLPLGLKELKISSCREVSKENLFKLSKACKNLEVLDIEKLDIDKEFLEDLGVNCTNLKSLKWISPKVFDSSNHLEFSNQVKCFTKLKSLKIVAHTFELPNIIDNVKELEELNIQIKTPTTNMIDFGKFSQLKNVVLMYCPFRKQEIMSLAKCKKLQYVTIKGCEMYHPDQEAIIKIIKGCLEIKHIKCLIRDINTNFISDINEIMKNRSGPIKVTAFDNSSRNMLLDAQYDTEKIDFNDVDSFFDEDSDLDMDDYEEYNDSDERFDPMDSDEFRFNGYDSDNSLPDYMFFADQFFNNFGLEYGLHNGLYNDGYDSDESF